MCVCQCSKSTVAEKYFHVFSSRFAVRQSILSRVSRSRFAVRRQLCLTFQVRASRFAVSCASRFTFRRASRFAVSQLCLAFHVPGSRFAVRGSMYMLANWAYVSSRGQRSSQGIHIIRGG